ncbi:hypothetical protein RIF29_13770 [Crotalaria pallida]|uniref:Uncharacterized protein n=1 Tax=Crotalaria pallida TaxID=3830 RepID=A0AAN9IQ75_CROPI
MEQEIVEELQSWRSLRTPRISSSIDRDSEEVNENLHYTSLKDIICNTPTRYTSLLHVGHDFDSSINIRNELVKRAASVYLQSTALLATRNQNCFMNLWEKLKSKAASYSFFRVCLCPLFRFLDHMVGRLARAGTLSYGCKLRAAKAKEGSYFKRSFRIPNQFEGIINITSNPQIVMGILKLEFNPTKGQHDSCHGMKNALLGKRPDNTLS